MFRIILVATLTLVPLAAQQATTRRGFVRAFGEGSVSVRPDIARLSFSVVTQAATANDAATRNADQSTAVINRLREVLGQNADIRTVSYSLNPNYTTPRDNTPPAITGYIATNTVQASVLDLSRIGQVIDVGIGAGATRVNGLQLSLRDEDPVRSQALRLAGQKARARADAIAAGLSVRLGTVVSAEEGISYRPVDVSVPANRLTITTPVEPGNLEVRAAITLEMEILP